MAILRKEDFEEQATLRDQFAMAALTGFIAEGCAGNVLGIASQALAEMSYRVADAEDPVRL